MNPFTGCTIKRSLCALTAGFAVLVTPLFAVVPPSDLFTDTTTQADLRPSGVVTRQHAVHVNTEVLKGATKPGSRINFNLFSDTAYIGVVETIETRGESYTLVGHIDGKDQSSFALVANHEAVVMNLRQGTTLSQLRYLGGGVHVVQQVDEKLFPPCANTAAHALRNTSAQDTLQPRSDAQADTGTTIDVMVVYTPKARIAAGGANAIQALIDLAFTESNTAYQQSQIIPRIRKVFTAEVNYTESGSFNTDLNNLTNPSDGVMDEVNAWRNASGADLVSLWTDDNGVCGLGWLLTSLSPNANNGFSVVYWGCATGYYSFAHEMGHNMGCAHDQQNASGQGLYPYSYGWRFLPYRTIMAYDPGIRVQHFSNPNVNYQGTPTGDPNLANNALTINNSASFVANFRQSIPSTNPPAILSLTPPRTLLAGTNVTFNVVATGSPLLSYQWRANNIDIPGATLPGYSINSVQLSDAATYSVFITNANGTTSGNVTLTVVVPPASQSVAVGSNVTFNVVVNGSVPSGYQWRSNNVNISGATQASYTINNAQLSNAANYSVVVTTTFGTVTTPNATLTVVVPSPLGLALDQPTLTWTTGGNTNWDAQTITTHDGVDAAMSGPLTDSQTTWFQTSVNGPLTMTFWWKVSSQQDFDFLTFSLNGLPQFSIAGEVGWQQRVVPLPAGSNNLRWDFTHDSIHVTPVGQDRGWVDQIAFSAPISYAEALDNSALTFTSSGDQAWIAQTATSHDGIDAAVSGNIISVPAPTQLSRLQTKVSGPSTLKFWWKVSSEEGYDFLRCSLDGTNQLFSITGEKGWEQRSVNIPAGAHDVAWQYDKDDSDVLPVGQDKGWVDQVTLTATSKIVSNSYTRGVSPRFSLQFTGVVGGSYIIQSSSNLLNWVNVTNITSLSTLISFSDLTATNQIRFYRVISP